MPLNKEQLHLPDQLLVDFLFCPHPLVVSDMEVLEIVIPAGTVIDVSVLQVGKSLLGKKKKISSSRSS